MTAALSIGDVAAEHRSGARHLLFHCGTLSAGEQALVVCDPTTRHLADIIAEEGARSGHAIEVIETPSLWMHGEEPSNEAAGKMCSADLVVGITAKSMAHTQARRDSAAAGARYLSLPEYSLDLLAARALRVDFRHAYSDVRKLADLFSAGRRIRVTSDASTDVYMDISGRAGNCCPGFVERAGELGSPPDIEANISPIESSGEGVVIVDGSIPYPAFGLLKEPVRLTLSGGQIRRIEGDRKLVSELERMFDAVDPQKSRVLAECGVGLNREAKLSGVMLTDEGAYGTMHLGFGSNHTVGGLNCVPFHLDFVFSAPTLSIDGQVVLDRGVLRF